MKNILLISEKELIESWSKKIFLNIIIFFIIFAGYLNFLSLEIYSDVSINTEVSPQIIMSADPNQGIFAPLFSNFFLFFLLIFPVVVSITISSEKDNGTYDILKLIFNDFSIIAGKFIAYFLLAGVLFLIAFLLLLPYIVFGGFVDFKYALNLFIGFVSISFFWISLALFISAITPQQLSFYLIITFNFIILGIDFISDIVNFPFLESIRKISPYYFYDIVLEGIFNLKYILGYIFSGIFLLIITLFINQRKKYPIFLIIAILWIVILLLVLRIDIKYDFTFNKINSLSENSIKVLNQIKDKQIDVNLYIRKNGPKWQTAIDLLKLFQISFDNIKFNFINPENSIKEYGTIEFVCDKNKIEQLSIDEDVFTESIYYVATLKKIKIDTKRVPKGKPYEFKGKIKTLYFLWILSIIFFIFIMRKIILKGGTEWRDI